MSKSIQIADDIALAYATPVLARVLPDHATLNPALREIILKREREDSGLKKSNIGGWHSEEDFLKWECPQIGALVRGFAQAVKSINDWSIGPDLISGDFDASAWANVCRRGDYHQPHFHPNNDWSAVYFVADGGNDADGHTQAGRIELLDPRGGIGMMHTPGLPFTGTLQYRPEPGLILVFPSWLVHHVHPHAGCDERISIAFNARMLANDDGSPSTTAIPAEPRRRKRFGLW